jgi:hypothetical protein
MALADVFVRLPWRTPAWRLNLLSAVMASATVVGLAWISQVRRDDFSHFDALWINLATSLSLAFAPLFWSQALITEVYTTAAFFVVLSMALWVKGGAAQRPLGWMFAAGMVWGLGISVHLTLVFMLPLWMMGRKLYATQGHAALKHAGVFGIGALLGLWPYVALSLRGPWPQPWGDLRTFSGWWHVVSGRLYWGFAFGLPMSVWPQRVLAYARLLVREFTPVGVLLMLQGVRLLWGRKRTLTMGLVSTFMAGSLYAIGYDTPDSLVYLVPLFPLAALWLREGLVWLVERGCPGWAVLVLPFAFLGLHWGAVDLHNDHEAVNWMAQVLDQTPRDALLLTARDRHTFALWYAQAALGLRPDVLVVDRDLWAEESYRRFLRSSGRPEDQIETLTLWMASGQPQPPDGSYPLCRVEDQEVYCR